MEAWDSGIHTYIDPKFASSLLQYRRRPVDIPAVEGLLICTKYKTERVAPIGWSLWFVATQVDFNEPDLHFSGKLGEAGKNSSQGERDRS